MLLVLRRLYALGVSTGRKAEYRAGGGRGGVVGPPKGEPGIGERSALVLTVIAHSGCGPFLIRGQGFLRRSPVVALTFLARRQLLASPKPLRATR